MKFQSFYRSKIKYLNIHESFIFNKSLENKNILGRLKKKNYYSGSHRTINLIGGGTRSDLVLKRLQTHNYKLIMGSFYIYIFNELSVSSTEVKIKSFYRFDTINE